MYVNRQARNRDISYDKHNIGTFFLLLFEGRAFSPALVILEVLYMGRLWAILQQVGPMENKDGGSCK